MVTKKEINDQVAVLQTLCADFDVEKTLNGWRLTNKNHTAYTGPCLDQNDFMLWLQGYTAGVKMTFGLVRGDLDRLMTTLGKG